MSIRCSLSHKSPFSAQKSGSNFAQAQSGCASFEFFADLAFCEARCHDVAEASALAQMGLS